MTKIKDIPVSDRPIERLITKGAESLNNEELIAILLRTGSKKASSKDLALNILKEIKEISNLKKISLKELLDIKGIGSSKAAVVLSAVELSKRMNIRYNEENKIKILSCEDVYFYYKDELENKEQEYFYAMYLDVKKRVLKSKLLFIGTLNYSLVNPREIFKEAFMINATSIICIHNHPSGDITPSKNDIDLTNHLKKLGDIHNVLIDDHVIVGKNKYYSFFENSLL